MSVQFISTNKNYKRLYNAPLDPSVVQDTYAEMLEYLNDPTCYINQIIGCDGSSYIVYEEDGVKKVRETGAPGFYKGPSPPKDVDMMWIDSSDDEIDNVISSSVIDEFRTILSAMQNKINKLEADIEYIKINGGGGIIPPITTTSYFIISEENDDIFITEDGDMIVLEEYTEGTVVVTTSNILMENDDVLITEDGEIVVLEEYVEDIPVTTTVSKLLMENDDVMIAEDNDIFINESND